MVSRRLGTNSWPRQGVAPVWGNDPRVIRAANDAERLSGLLRECGVHVPQTRRSPPTDTSGWLRKRVGACGGDHVRRLGANDELGPGEYCQRQVPGRTVSVSVLGCAGAALALGVCETWQADPGAGNFTYAGGVRLAAADLPHTCFGLLQSAAEAIAVRLRLRGLNGCDFIVDGSRFWLIDVNPRPTATFELFDGEAALFGYHVAAAAGNLSAVRWAPTAPQRHRAQRVVYASTNVQVGAGRWPPWVTDRPAPDTAIGPGEPICTVHGAGASAAAATAAVRRRYNNIHGRIHGQAPCDPAHCAT